MEAVTGYKRSYRVVVRKMLNEAILSGYPKVYPTAIDLANGYFVLGGAQIPVMTDNELQNLTQSEYEARISLLKNYVIQQEGMNPFTNQFNENVVYDPTNCVPEVTTTTTSEEEPTTTTTSAPVTTTTTTEEVTTTTTTEQLCSECVEYGYLYNRYTVEDARDIANTGWHVPTYAEVITLFEYYDPTPSGSYYDVGNNLKEAGTTHWNSPNSVSEVGRSGLNLRGSGERDQYDGSFWGLKDYANYHCSTTVSGYGDGFYASNSDGWMNMVYLIAESDKQAGWAIRLIKDSTTLSHGQTGTYVGNDGKVYCTICVGTQEWVAESLAETEYRNHDAIPLVTDGATWAGLISGGRAAYDNSNLNVGCGE